MARYDKSVDVIELLLGISFSSKIQLTSTAPPYAYPQSIGM